MNPEDQQPKDILDIQNLLLWIFEYYANMKIIEY